MKVTISIADDILAKVDERAKKNFMSRSAFITQSVIQRMDADDAMTMMPDVLEALKKLQVAEGGE